ncbi:MAG TPA: alpha/beta hydrolase [Verrucomicrobiae bacterium]|jgi:pimeloyl-ACP methyl ester carboxylesterase|nr:alpha/beta hydrolase [Verrucomicrobiae bacterium]
MPDTKITVVLVHGAWAECASWTEIILPLQKQGFGVICAPIHLTSLSDDVGALNRVLNKIAGDIVLVGHAYAGAVIGATGNERVKLLVYVAALAPDEGETVADVFYREPPHSQAPKLAPDDSGFIWMPSEGFEHAFAQNAGPDVKSVLLATQRPINVKCIQEKAPRPLWKDKPSWFLIAENDRMIPAKTQHFQAERMGATARAHAVDHSPMLTAPNIVIDVLVEAMRNISS